MKNTKSAEIKALIFDLGGVMVKNSDPHVFRKMSKFFAVPLNLFETALKKNLKPYAEGRINDKEFFEILAKELGVLHKNSFSKYKKMMTDAYLASAKIDANFLKFIKKLRKNYIIAALTNTIHLHERLNIKRKLFSHFDFAFRSNRLGMSKPYYTIGAKNPTRIYRHVCKKIHIEPKNCIFIDDMKPNLVPARMLGMKTIHYKNYKQFLAELKKLRIKI